MLGLLGFGRDCGKLGLLFVAATTFRAGPQCPDGAAPGDVWRRVKTRLYWSGEIGQ
jgi:hypothetical protein